jgi:hypothetical protein
MGSAVHEVAAERNESRKYLSPRRKDAKKRRESRIQEKEFLGVAVLARDIISP